MNKYRYNDYYGMTATLDELYDKSLKGEKFTKLMRIIMSPENLKLAYRMIKSNTGSRTSGTDGITIDDLKELQIEEYLTKVTAKLENFKPDVVKRVMIPKDHGEKLRPIGIPTMMDRIVQQAIRQVLEPICEAKFHNHSYGFRPNRSTKHALSRFYYLVQKTHCLYAVDVDIKGFFDNVNHNKLIKQLFSLGVQDRKLLKIIKLMLKAPIQGEGIPDKGTPQGGILSPLLSNVVLNELDWWISSQWETFETKTPYNNQSNKYRAIKNSNLKKMFFVRYADDFKILCTSREDAKKILFAVEKWLKTRLGLEISPEKSKIVNLRKNYSEFLGVKVKVYQKGKKEVVISHMRDKAKEKITLSIKNHVEIVSKSPTKSNVNKLNSVILGEHGYYNAATMVAEDFREIAFAVSGKMYNCLHQIGTKGIPKRKTFTYEKFYGKSLSKTWTVNDIPIFPIRYVSHKKLMSLNQEINDYTVKGRELSSKKLSNSTDLRTMMLSASYIADRSIEYNDNRVSRASKCGFKCEVTGMELDISEIHCHHKIPVSLGGNDSYQNLRIVHREIHILIHAKSRETIEKYKYLVKDKKSESELNKLRSFCKLDEITIN